jgi:hypoxanthine phosphoribosyltransferase
MTLDEINRVFAEADCLHDATEVSHALDKVAAEITARHRTTNPLVLCVMNGGLVVTGCLLPRLQLPLEYGYLHATRYRGETSGGELHWQAEISHDLQDRHVIVVDDILDEGHTLAAIVAHCQAQGAKQVESMVLVEKMHPRKQDIRADYVGLQVEDRYLFGYGMDYKGYWRNANGIYAVKGM